MKDKQMNLFDEIVSEEDIKNRSWNLLSKQEKEEIKKTCEERSIEAKKLADQRKEDLRIGRQATVDLLFDM